MSNDYKKVDDKVEIEEVEDVLDMPDNYRSSSFSNRDRKRKIEDIETRIRSGEYTQKQKCDTFIAIIDSSNTELDCVRCRKCAKILSAGHGGHKSRGDCVQQKEDRSIRRPTIAETKKITDVIVKYLIRSGESFHHAESPSFRDLVSELISIGAPGFSTDNLNLACEETLRSEVEKQGKVIQQEIGQLIRGPIERKEACFVLDFGKKVHNFLSIFVGYVDREHGKPSLKVVPFLFTPMFEPKTTENIFDLIVDGAEKIGFKEESVKNVRIVADGAANMKKLNDYFKSYSLCSCHSIQKSAERCINPLKDHEKKFDEEEKKVLKKVSDSIDTCSDLAVLLRRKREKFPMEKLPTAYCSTRWLTFMYCVRDIIAMQTEIEKFNDSAVRRLMEKLKPNLPLLMTAMRILKLYEHLLKLFEKTGENLHEVAPILFELQKTFEAEEKRGSEENDFPLHTISKSARISLNHYIENTVGDAHLLATLLCPGMKKLRNFPDEYKQKTIDLIHKEIESIVLDEVAPRNQSGFMSKIYDDVSPPATATEEYDAYERMKLTASDQNMPMLEFWDKYADRFPRLSKIAAGVFCVLASETCCERAFSALNNVFRVDRQRLDPEFVETLMVSFLYTNMYT